MYSINRIGPRGEPCGTPILRKHLFDLELSIVTVKYLLIRYDVNHTVPSTKPTSFFSFISLNVDLAVLVQVNKSYYNVSKFIFPFRTIQ